MTSNPGQEEAVSELRGRVAAKVAQIKRALRGEIAAHGMREGEVSQLLGYSRTYLSNLFGPEDGQRGPTKLRVETLLATLDILDIDPLEFFSRVLAPRRGVGGEVGDQAFLEALASRDIGTIAALASRPEGVPKDQLQRVVQATLDLVVELKKAVEEDGKPLPRSDREPGAS